MWVPTDVVYRTVRAGRGGTKQADPQHRKVSIMAQATYEIRVSGTLPAELLTELGTLDVIVEPPETVLFGSLPDQSALFGLITRIHGLGLHLVGVRRMGADGGEAADVEM